MEEQQEGGREGEGYGGREGSRGDLILLFTITASPPGRRCACDSLSDRPKQASGPNSRGSQSCNN